MADNVTNTTLRYSTDGLDQARQQLQQFGDDGDDALGRVADAADGASESLDRLAESSDKAAQSGDNLSSFAATLSPLQQQLDAFSAGLDKINDGFSVSIDSSASLGQALGDVKTGIADVMQAELGFVAALATGYAAVANSNYAKTLTADIQNLQRATGDSYASYAATGDAIKALDGDSAGATAAIDRIKDAILGVGDAAPQTRQALDLLGVSLSGLSANDAPQVLQDIIDKSKDYADSRQKTALIEAATGQSSVQWLKEIANAQDFTNAQTQQAETVLGQMAQSAIDADERIKQVNSDPGLFGSIIQSIKDATTVSEQWAEDAGRSSQEVSQGWRLLWAGFANTNWSAVTDGWDALNKGAHNYALTLENELIPDWGKYIGLVAEAPDFGKVGGAPKATAPNIASTITPQDQAAIDKYTESLNQENEALLLTQQEQNKLNDQTAVYNEVMGLFSGKSAEFLAENSRVITSLLDQGNAFAALKRSMDDLKTTEDDFKKTQDDARDAVQKNLDTLQQQAEQEAAQAKAEDDQRQQAISDMRDEADQSAVLLQAFKDGAQAYSDAQESEQILTAVRQLGADATQAEKDQVANLTAAIVENNAALDAAKQAQESQDTYAADIASQKQKNDLLQQELALGASLKGQQDARLVGQEAELKYESQNPGLLQSEYDAYGQLITQQTELNNAIKAQNTATQTLVTDVGKAGETVFTQMFSDVANKGVKAFSDFGNYVYQEFVKLASEIAVLLIFHPEVSISSALSAVTGGSALAGGSSALGLAGDAGTLYSAGGLFSATGSIGGLFSSGSAFEVPTFATDGSVASLTNFGADAGIFSSGGSIGSIFSSGGALSGVGSVLGSIGSALPFLGLAGLAGSLLGSLFGGPPQNNDGVVFVGSNHGDGQLHIAGSTSDHQDLSGAFTAAQSLVTDVNSFVKQYGLSVTGGNSQGIGISVGQNRNTAYSANEAESIQKLIKDGDFSSTNPAIEALLKSTKATDLSTLASQIQAIQNGASALSATLDLTGHAVTSVQSSMAQLSKQFETDKADAVTYGFTVAQVTKGYQDAFNTSISDSLLAIQNPEKAALESEARDAAARLNTAKELGANILQVEQVNADARLAIIKQYGQAAQAAAEQQYQNVASLRAALLTSQGNTEGASLVQSWASEASQIDAVKKELQDGTISAKLAWIEILTIEETGQNDRLNIVKTANAQAKASAEQLIQTAESSLSNFVKTLQTGPLSALTPRQQFYAALEQENYQAALAAKGNVTAAANLPSYIQTLLTDARAQFGSTAEYSAIYQKVLLDLKAAGGALGTDEALKNAELVARTTADAGKNIVGELKILNAQIANLVKINKSNVARPHGLNAAA